MLNKIMLAGRLTRDPEIRYTQSQKAVTTFTLAVERDYAPKGEEQQTEHGDCCRAAAVARLDRQGRE